MDYNDSMCRLAKEYISKCKCCDECFCSCFCTVNGLRKSRRPYEECFKNIIKYLETLT